MELKGVDGKTDETNKGFIIVQLSRVTRMQTTADAVANARNDIEHSGIGDGVMAVSNSNAADVAELTLIPRIMTS